MHIVGEVELPLCMYVFYKQHGVHVLKTSSKEEMGSTSKTRLDYF